MAIQEEVSLAGSKAEDKIEDPSEMMALAVQEVEHCLQVTDDSLSKIYSEIGCATSKHMIRPVFRRSNSFIQIFLRLVPAARYSGLIAKALGELGVSPLLFDVCCGGSWSLHS